MTSTTTRRPSLEREARPVQTTWQRLGEIASNLSLATRVFAVACATGGGTFAVVAGITWWVS